MRAALILLAILAVLSAIVGLTHRADKECRVWLPTYAILIDC